MTMPYTEQYIRDLKQLLRVFLIINTIAAVVVLLGVVLIIRQQHQITSQNEFIQQQRTENILSQCENQNSRRANTIATLNQEILSLKGKRRIRAERNEGFTIALINALAPHQNCLRLVRKAVRPIS